MFYKLLLFKQNKQLISNLRVGGFVRTTRCDTVYFSGKKSPSVSPLMSYATPLSRDAIDADWPRTSISALQSSEPTERSIRSKFKLVQLYHQVMAHLLWSSLCSRLRASQNHTNNVVVQRGLSCGSEPPAVKERRKDASDVRAP